MKLVPVHRVALLLIVSACIFSVDQAMAKGKKGKSKGGNKAKVQVRTIKSIGITKEIGQGPIPSNAEDLTEASPSGLTTLRHWKRPSKPKPQPVAKGKKKKK